MLAGLPELLAAAELLALRVPPPPPSPAEAVAAADKLREPLGEPLELEA